jgi:hypothetical protein
MMFLPYQPRGCLRSVGVFFHIKANTERIRGKVISTCSLHSSIPENTPQIQTEFLTQEVLHHRPDEWSAAVVFSGTAVAFRKKKKHTHTPTHTHTHTHTHTRARARARASVGKFGTLLYMSCCVSKGM